MLPGVPSPPGSPSIEVIITPQRRGGGRVNRTQVSICVVVHVPAGLLRALEEVQGIEVVAAAEEGGVAARVAGPGDLRLHRRRRAHQGGRREQEQQQTG
jgi:hypothetical protein